MIAMVKEIPDPLLWQFSSFLATRMGLHFPPSRWPDMLRGLERAALEFDLPGSESCMRWLLASPLERSKVETLASHLTVGETYFCREPTVFAALERDVLPPLIAARRATSRHLRIWSAGCCTGEEPYSLAILLSRLIPDIEHWNITLLATDINPHFLSGAVRGEYREWSFRGTPVWFRQDYFERSEAGNYAVQRRFRRLVSFDYLNLVDDVYPSLTNSSNGMDIVLCRNVLMYFEPDTMRAVVNKLHRSLSEGGWLVVSLNEAGAVPLSGFTAVEFADASLYRKDKDRLDWKPTPGQESSVPPSSRTEIPASVPQSTASGITQDTTTHSLAEKRPASVTGGEVYGQALAYYAQGAYAQAAELMADALDTDTQGLALAAHACANLGRLDEAYRWCEAAVAADKCNPGLRYLLASVLTEQGKVEAAAAALKQALYLDHDFVLAHFALGNLYRHLGRAAEATRHFTNARNLLASYPPGTPLPDAEGLTAGRLIDVIDSGELIA